MTTFNWQVNKMDRLASDGFIVVVHYTVSATDTTYTSSIYSTISFTQQLGVPYTPYEQLTEIQVVGWVQNAINKNATEAALVVQINALKNPVQVAGVPWI